MRKRYGLVWVGLVVAACGGTADTPEPPAKKAPGVSTGPAGGGTPEVNGEQPEAQPEPPPETPQAEYPLDETLRFNQIQFKGTHNSYHLEPADPSPEEVYSMPPLDAQLALGFRAFELDIHYYRGEFFVYHLPVDDADSTCPRLAGCLAAIRGWSDAHPTHQPLMVFFDPRDEYDAEKIKDHLDELDAALLAAFPRERVVTPDDLIGDAADLRAAIAARGWPAMGDVRGKILFVLWSFGDLPWLYAGGGRSLAGRVMFVAATAPGSRHAMILGMDTAQTQEAQIRSAVESGYVVRTRADDLPGRGGDFPARRDAALRSGAQAVLTDYPEGLGSYRVEIPGGTPSRCNPVALVPECTPADVEH